MGASAIEWTDVTWNPILGCTKVSDGCTNCYAIKEARRHMALPAYVELTERHTDGSLNWTGAVHCLPDRLTMPLHMKAPARIFVNSMADLFHPDVPDQFILDVYTVMRRAYWHTFQILTKRPDRMADFTNRLIWVPPSTGAILDQIDSAQLWATRVAGWQATLAKKPTTLGSMPVNIWHGTSTENQATFDARVPHLRRTKSRIRWISAEPLLGPLYLGKADWLDWLVAGGESGGSDARRLVERHPYTTTTAGYHNEHGDWEPSKTHHGFDWRPKADALDWVHNLEYQCDELGIPFLFKQWGGPRSKTAGRLVDGHPWDGYPDTKALIV